MMAAKDDEQKPVEHFRLSKDPYRYWWPVTIRKPVDGGYELHRVQCQFQVVGEDDLEDLGAMYARYADPKTLRDIVVGWKGFQNETGAELPFNAKHLDRVLRIFYVRQGIGRGYINSLAGIEEKN
jgi:hypothetical protein